MKTATFKTKSELAEFIAGLDILGGDIVYRIHCDHEKYTVEFKENEK